MTDELEKLKADNAALREVLNEMAGKFGGSVQVGSLYHQAQTLLSTEHPGAEILRERDELRAEVERLRKRLEIIDGHEEFDGIACRDETIQQLESEVERLREGIQDGCR